jgi:N-methylhydantoinase A/oxoprolinase/acetone carboxylase beta subunit
MSLILGIDTGGTYTDGVIIHSKTRKLLCKAKAFTTKSDLMVGINNCLEQLDGDLLKGVRLACLSTTLATNAIVEGRGGKVGLLVSGGSIDDRLPKCFRIDLSGKIDIKGKVLEDLDTEEIDRAINDLKRQHIDAVAISSFASVRNPVHELAIKRQIMAHLPVPIVCAHELSSLLGYQERTVTAVLNARLIPIVTDLIESTRTVLAAREIPAEIMVVRGDGSLMNEQSALGKPIETILSGPAASVIGGMFLTGEKEALIVDIGGTTTDIANLHNGAVKLRKSGARVGGWSTQIKAADICSFGLGGDSYIQVDAQGQIKIGPHKVKPLSLASFEHPELGQELAQLQFQPGFELFSEQETNGFALVPQKSRKVLAGQDADLAELLRDGPHTAQVLASALKRDIENLRLEPLVEQGVLERIALTPTDILHALGQYTAWDTQAVQTAIQILAAKVDLPAAEFIGQLHDEIIKALARACVQSIADFEKQTFDLGTDPAAQYFFDKAFASSHPSILTAAYTVQKPIVAVGAPAKAWMGRVCELLNTRLIVPEHAEVANAVGAAVGQVLETADALIRPDRKKERFILHLPASIKTFETLQAAKAYGLAHLKEYVVDLAKQSGSGYTHAYAEAEDISVKSTKASEETYVETRIRATAVGHQVWKN